LLDHLVSELGLPIGFHDWRDHWLDHLMLELGLPFGLHGFLHCGTRVLAWYPPSKSAFRSHCLTQCGQLLFSFRGKYHPPPPSQYCHKQLDGVHISEIHGQIWCLAKTLVGSRA
jgi:hypothetical protein